MRGNRWLLGPCPCSVCGKHLFWDGLRWWEAERREHRCVEEAA